MDGSTPNTLADLSRNDLEAEITELAGHLNEGRTRNGILCTLRAGDRHGRTVRQMHKLLNLPYEDVLPISSMRGVADNLPGRVA
jgi:hypothetical protein